MKESEFIKQNKEKWLDFEDNLLRKDVNPAKTSKLFVQIIEDLSHARTFYPNRSVRIYLNGIAKLLFNDINKANKKRFSAFIDFWRKDLPLTMYAARRAMLISLIVFTGCFILGVVTSRHDPKFARTILSNDYVNMTNENIAKGDAMAVYKSNGEMETFLPIFYNNIKVDFLTFFLGIFMAVGTLLVMVVNGVMVGVFQYFFIEKGLFWESFLAIWTHGSLEIPAIILSGGAGMTLGKGLLFPGTYSRFQAFRISGINGLKIIMGVAPLTLLAAFVEGFLTRHTNIPDAIRFSFILLSFGFIILYFIWYPARVARRTQDVEALNSPEQVYTAEVVFNPGEILGIKKIISETFRLMFKHIGFWGALLFFSSLAFALLVSFNPEDLFYPAGNHRFGLVDFFNYPNFPILAVASGLLFCFIQVRAMLFLKRHLIKEESGYGFFRSPALLHTIYTAILMTLLFVGLLMIENDVFIYISFILLPLLIFIPGIAANQNISFLNAIGLTGNLLKSGLTAFISVSAVFFMVGGLVYLATAAALKTLLIEDALIWSLTDDDTVAQKISLCVSVFQSAASFLTYLVLAVISNGLLFYSLQETYTAKNLISKINHIKAVR